MITVKIADLLNSVDVLKALANKDFKAKLAWSISRLLQAAEKEIQNFNETRYALIRKYGTKDENDKLITDENGNCKIEADVVTEFNDELNELVNTEVEINANKINIGLIEDLEFTPSEMAVLAPYLEMDE